MNKAAQNRTVSLHFPVYLIGSERAPIIVRHANGQFAIGFSNHELAELVAAQIGAKNKSPIGILSYGSPATLLATIESLLAHGVTRMSWNLTDDTRHGYVVDLARVVRDWSQSV